ncbi:hypothetical protein HQ305_16860 [Rhodococcus sp. BP-149]|uniref:hypothetical protein n=1 Tax=unclassified Rhodococcus (in: high G+C Gram-positive bacteria) TaxID=192944 RepID=UPI001C9B31A4|nr:MULTISPECIES: hypothetical protein [unclassified Rhodococcus (in: high G+C Gram-positive bacteria)]MBY6687232.1 hypothetical protein [Rhodococcus sp. BP-288]MBY6694345.1 hypothetical protein [Rhodococcus sp. BP-188]MBY6698054.1 hypothetical protein [Rhodococcus sp. BP-285]MBY6704274.1 hypothetical protein [Rhodococcus sp. BP-283]MBY6712923.1 hypothetical protein [Rhodococcus sp. BP-160]
MQRSSQPPDDVRAYGFTGGLPDELEIPQLHVSPADAALKFWSGGDAPQGLVVQSRGGARTRHRWSDHDSAMMSLFAGNIAVSEFEATNADYSHPRRALVVSESAILYSSTTMIAEIRPIRRHIHRLAQRSVDYPNIDPTLRAALWSAAMTAWCAELVVGSRTSSESTRLWIYSVESVRLATDNDPHFSDRLKLWLDEYLRMTAYMVERARRPEE